AFATQNDEFCQRDEINDSDRAVSPAAARYKQPQQTAEPQRKCCGIHQSDLLPDELCWTERDVFVAVCNVAQYLVGGPVMPRLPENVGQCDGKCDQHSKPDPFVSEMAALRGQQQRNENSDAKENGRMFVFNAQSEQHAEPNPKRRRTAVDDADKKIDG